MVAEEFALMVRDFFGIINQRVELSMSDISDIKVTLEDLKATHARLFAAFIAQSEAAAAARATELDGIVAEIKAMQQALLAKLPVTPTTK